MIKGMPINEVTELIGNELSDPGNCAIISAINITFTPNKRDNTIKTLWSVVLLVILAI